MLFSDCLRHSAYQHPQAVYPAITVTIKPTNPNIHPLLFSAVHFLMFSSGDFLGRHLCSFPRLIIWSARRILALALLRTLFIPAFLLCNVEHAFPVAPFINSDFVYMLLLCALGVSNGYVSTLCMLGAPSLEHNKRLRDRQEDVDVAGTVAAFCLIVGLAVGSFASFGVRAVICECNPFAS